MTPAMGAWSLNHWATKEVPLQFTFFFFYLTPHISFMRVDAQMR